jgi:hypothetical protein
MMCSAAGHTSWFRVPGSAFSSRDEAFATVPPKRPALGPLPHTIAQGALPFTCPPARASAARPLRVSPLERQAASPSRSTYRLRNSIFGSVHVDEESGVRVQIT